MTCPFYGMHDHGLGVGVVGVLRPSHGNQCALVRPWFSPCWMQMARLPVEWRSCCLRASPDPSKDHLECSVRCVGCRSEYPVDCDGDGAEGLCPTCLHHAELLALEAAGQQRLIP